MKKLNFTFSIKFLGLLFLGLLFLGCSSSNTTDSSNDTTDYIEVIIGNQVWMDKNLNTDHFRNGDVIPQAETKQEWVDALDNKQPAWCYYENDSDNGEKYGKLYNWWAVNDSRGLAPSGWHIPTNDEWIVLQNYLGGESIAGNKMKDNFDWKEDNGLSGNGSNESGFSAIPAGSCSSYFEFEFLGIYSCFWSSSEDYLYEGLGMPWICTIANFSKALFRDVKTDKFNGLSVRCIKGDKSSNNNNQNAPTEIIEETTKNIDETSEEINNSNDNNSINQDLDKASYINDYGEVVYTSPFYMITTGAFPSEMKAQENINYLRNVGYNNVGYLWIPDYSSLSGKQFFSTFIGPFNSKIECENQFKQISKSNDWYIRYVSK